ncbi:MAG: TetR/AcrR family transcriptional regulator [Bacteroidales bacterium]|nr:TetR/AcrR family transcriptional regulator [Bacteroidales bacterium]
MTENIQEKIAESFEKHYNQFGFKKTSIDDISRDLRISKKTIYKHFNSKEQIFNFLVQKIAGQFHEMIEPKLMRVPTYEKKMEQLVFIIFQEIRNWLKESQDSFEFRFQFELTQKAFQEAYHSLVKELFIAGIENGEFSKTNIELTIKFLDSILLESMKLIHVNHDLGIEQDTARSILKLLK